MVFLEMFVKIVIAVEGLMGAELASRVASKRRLGVARATVTGELVSS